jgi:hypothetical protein
MTGASGCAWRTLGEDLAVAIAVLAREPRSDSAFVESTGVSAPTPVVERFASQGPDVVPLGEVARVDTTVGDASVLSRGAAVALRHAGPGSSRVEEDGRAVTPVQVPQGDALGLAAGAAR